MTTFAASRCRPRPDQPARSANRSSTIQPMLWRVCAYCEPGFPSPTTIFTKPPGHADKRPNRSVGTPRGPRSLDPARRRMVPQAARIAARPCRTLRDVKGQVGPFDHRKVIASVASEMLVPLGLVRLGRSMAWVDDYDW